MLHTGCRTPVRRACANETQLVAGDECSLIICERMTCINCGYLTTNECPHLAAQQRLSTRHSVHWFLMSSLMSPYAATLFRIPWMHRKHLCV